MGTKNALRRQRHSSAGRFGFRDEGILFFRFLRWSCGIRGLRNHGVKHWLGRLSGTRCKRKGSRSFCVTARMRATRTVDSETRHPRLRLSWARLATLGGTVHGRFFLLPIQTIIRRMTMPLTREHALATWRILIFLPCTSRAMRSRRCLRHRKASLASMQAAIDQIQEPHLL